MVSWVARVRARDEFRTCRATAITVRRGCLRAAVLLAAVLAMPATSHADAIDSVRTAVADTPTADSASLVDRTPVTPCRPWVAFGLGMAVPGGGQFYLGDWIGGIESVVADLLVFEALRRSGATGSSMALFIGSMHLVEAMFAVQDCRLANARRTSTASRERLRLGGELARTVAAGSRPNAERWKLSVGLSIPISISHNEPGSYASATSDTYSGRWRAPRSTERSHVGGAAAVD